MRLYFAHYCFFAQAREGKAHLHDLVSIKDLKQKPPSRHFAEVKQLHFNIKLNKSVLSSLKSFDCFYGPAQHQTEDGRCRR